MQGKISKKKDRVLIWEGEATETSVIYYSSIDLTKFEYLIIKMNASELMLLPITGAGKYNGSMITFASSNMYLKAFLISITNDHAYIEIAKEKIIGNNSISAGFSSFKIFKIYGVY